MYKYSLYKQIFNRDFNHQKTIFVDLPGNWEGVVEQFKLSGYTFMDGQTYVLKNQEHPENGLVVFKYVEIPPAAPTFRLDFV